MSFCSFLDEHWQLSILTVQLCDIKNETNELIWKRIWYIYVNGIFTSMVLLHQCYCHINVIIISNVYLSQMYIYVKCIFMSMVYLCQWYCYVNDTVILQWSCCVGWWKSDKLLYRLKRERKAKRPKKEIEVEQFKNQSSVEKERKRKDTEEKCHLKEFNIN